MTLEVLKQQHNKAREKKDKDGKPDGMYPESFSLVCLDKSMPAKHRMEEMLNYRLRPEEKALVWDKAEGKLIEIGVSKIRHSEFGDKKATMIGEIIKVL
jgi:hypothetical protein